MRLPILAVIILIPAQAMATPPDRPLAIATTTHTAPLTNAAAEAFSGKRYKEAVLLATRVLKADPGNRQALAVLHSAKGRTNEISLIEKASPTRISSPRPAASAALPGVSLPRDFRRQATPPPALPGSPYLDPTAAGYWDKQLLGPLLARSDANPVAREYLSPLLKANKVTLRLGRVSDDPDLRGSWGYFNLKTSVIHYNLDAINADIRQYDAFYAKSAPARLVRPIDEAIPLDPAQIEFVTGRFLPLAVHEAGGHATHSSDLKQRLGALRAPLNKDTEIMAWRLEAAAIEIERRRDKSYLTEPTGWANEENVWIRKWKDSRHRKAPDMIVDYLDSMPSYTHLVHVGTDPTIMRERYSESVALVQSACRMRYDEACSTAITCLATLYPPEAQELFERARVHLDSHPNDAANRARVMDLLSQTAIVQDRLDPKGITVVSAYYKEQEREVQRLEGLADPLTIWQKLRTTWQ